MRWGENVVENRDGGKVKDVLIATVGRTRATRFTKTGFTFELHNFFFRNLIIFRTFMIRKRNKQFGRKLIIITVKETNVFNHKNV